MRLGPTSNAIVPADLAVDRRLTFRHYKRFRRAVLRGTLQQDPISPLTLLGMGRRCRRLWTQYFGAREQGSSPNTERYARGKSKNSARHRELILLSLLLLVASFIPAQAAMTVSARGTGGNTTGATSVTVTPASNLAAGSMGVIVVAADNAGAAGSALNCNASMADSVGNTWTLRLDVLFDNGAASAGIELCVYTGHIATAFTTANNVVVGFGNSVTAKSWTLTEVVPTAGLVPQFVTGAGGTGATSATPTVTTSSITSGNVVIGGGAAEATLAWTGDADTTNGTWANEQEIGNGTGTSGAAVTSQAKVVTATATQTYNPTLTSADQIIGWIQIAEAPPGMGKRIIRM